MKGVNLHLLSVGSMGLDTIAAIPHIARYFLREASTPPKWCDTPPLALSFTQTHLCDTPFCNVSRDNCAIPHENKHENVCDTIATSIARYENYRCWASILNISLCVHVWRHLVVTQAEVGLGGMLLPSRTARA